MFTTNKMRNLHPIWRVLLCNNIVGLRAYSILSISFLPALQVKDSKVDGACQPRRVNPAVG